MGKRSSFHSLIAAVTIAVALASCDRKTPTSPPNAQPGPNAAAVVRIEIVAPAEIAPGEFVQLRANAVKPDGSVENVTHRVQWYSEVSDILELSSTGQATGRNRGEVLATARFDGRTATERVLVLPKGTYRLGGTISELGVELPGVILEVLSGVGEGFRTVSGFDGSYALYGVRGAIRLRLKKEGYINGLQDLDVSAHRSQDFGMAAEREYSPDTMVRE